MPQTREKVQVKLPSGETVNAIVPAGMDDAQVGALMRQKHPEFFPAQTTQAPAIPAGASAGIPQKKGGFSPGDVWRGFAQQAGSIMATPGMSGDSAKPLSPEELAAGNQFSEQLKAQGKSPWNPLNYLGDRTPVTNMASTAWQDVKALNPIAPALNNPNKAEGVGQSLANVLMLVRSAPSSIQKMAGREVTGRIPVLNRFEPFRKPSFKEWGGALREAVRGKSQTEPAAPATASPAAATVKVTDMVSVGKSLGLSGEDARARAAEAVSQFPNDEKAAVDYMVGRRTPAPAQTSKPAPGGVAPKPTTQAPSASPAAQRAARIAEIQKKAEATAPSVAERYTASKPTPEPTTKPVSGGATPAPQVALREAYDQLVAESGFPDVRIADLARTGPNAMQMIRELQQQGKVQLSRGDWSLASDEEKNAAIKWQGENYLRLRYIKPPEPVRSAAPTPAEKAEQIKAVQGGPKRQRSNLAKNQRQMAEFKASQTGQQPQPADKAAMVAKIKEAQAAKQPAADPQAAVQAQYGKNYQIAIPKGDEYSDAHWLFQDGTSSTGTNHAGMTYPGLSDADKAQIMNSPIGVSEAVKLFGNKTGALRVSVGKGNATNVEAFGPPTDAQITKLAPTSKEFEWDLHNPEAPIKTIHGHGDFRAFSNAVRQYYEEKK